MPIRPPGATIVDGQINLRDAIRRTIEFTSPEGKKYKLNDKIATLLVRPRGWHLDEKHVLRGRQADLRLACSISACTSSTTRSS